MKNISKRIVALVLAVAMMITSLPTIASADSVTLKQDEKYTKVTVGQEIRLVKNDGKDLGPNDVTGGDWSLSYKKNHGDEWGQSSLSNLELGGKSSMPSKIVAGDAGLYKITFSKDQGPKPGPKPGPKVTRNWYYEIEETKIYFQDKLVLEEEYKDFENDIIKDINTNIYDDELENQQERKIADCVKNSFEDEEYTYTLLNGNERVELLEADYKKDNVNYFVNIKPEYKKAAKPCYEKVIINYIQGQAGVDNDQVSRKEILVDQNLFDDKYTTKQNQLYDKDEEFDVLTYIKDELIDATDKKNKVKRDYKLNLEKTEVSVGTMDRTTRTRTVTITPWYDRVDVVVTFVYDGQTISTQTVDVKGNALKDDQVKAAEDAARKLEVKDETKFEYFTDENGDKVELKGKDAKRFATSTTLVAVFKTIGKTTIEFGHYEDEKFVKDAEDKKVPTEELNKAQDKNKFIVDKSIDVIKNYVVKEIKFENNKYRVVFATLQYTVKYELDGNEVLVNNDVYYVLDRNERDTVKEDKENAEKIIKDNELSKNITVENVTGKYKGFDVFATAVETIKNIKLFFTSGLVNPVQLVHQFNFHDVDKNLDIIIPIGTDEIEKAHTKEGKKEIFDAYKDKAMTKKDGERLILDTANLGDEAIQLVKKAKEEDKVVFNYRARLIKVTTRLVDADNKEVEIPTTRSEYESFGAHDSKNAESLKALVNKYAVAIDKYDFVEGTATPDKNYTAKSADAKENDNKYDDYNVINVVLTYKQNKQAFCEHEGKYIDNGDDHSIVCALCDKVLKEHEAHEYTKHVCVCGHEEPGKAITLKMDVTEGLTKTSVNGAELSKSVEKYAYEIAQALDESDDKEEAIKNAPQGTSYADEFVDNIKAEILVALEKEENLVNENDKWYIKNVMHDANYDVYYNITVELKTASSTYTQVELWNVTDFDSVRAGIKAEVARQKSISADYLAVEEFDKTIEFLEFGGVYDCTVRFFTNADQTEELTFVGKVHLNQSSGKKRKPADPIKIDPNMTPEAGALLDDLRNNRPNDLITRAEFVGILANLFQVPEDRIYDKAWNLEDCAQRADIEKFATYIIVKGYSDEEFGQNDIITIEQVYTILTRALQFQQKVKAMTNEEIEAEIAKANYVAEVSDWAKEGVSVAIKVGIAAATETNPTEPQNGVMRITAADTLQKYLEVVAAPNAEAEVKVEE